LPSAGPKKMPSLLMGTPFALLHALRASYGRSEASVSPERTNAGSIHRSAWKRNSANFRRLGRAGFLRLLWRGHGTKLLHHF